MSAVPLDFRRVWTTIRYCTVNASLETRNSSITQTLFVSCYCLRRGYMSNIKVL